MTFAFEERSGYTVWNVVIGNRVLASKWVVRLSSEVDSMGLNENPSPAFRIRVLIFVILFAASVSKRVLESSSGDERERL